MNRVATAAVKFFQTAEGLVTTIALYVGAAYGVYAVVTSMTAADGSLPATAAGGVTALFLLLFGAAGIALYAEAADRLAGALSMKVLQSSMDAM